jgi:crotonobetainyl-CoA:carnitine CoA-transferase CaiB-like acyl-CoA transferase
VSAFLEGVRVLDVTGALAGPYCTTVLSDLGADVIKVEPLDGDAIRGRWGDSLSFDMVHRNKRSFAVDLKTERGHALVRRLALTADVVVENFRPGSLARLGLGPDELLAERPDIVYCSISGFGQTGPLRDAQGYDLIAQAFGGLLSATGSADGAPAAAGFPVGDLGAGMWGAIGVLAALLRARSGGGGAYVDVSLAETVAGWSVWEVADYVATGESPGAVGAGHRRYAPYGAFACGDGRSIMLVGGERYWPRLCEVLGSPELAADPRWDTDAKRLADLPALTAELEGRLSAATRDEWVARFRAAGVPCGPINTIEELVADPHLRSRGLFASDPELTPHVLVNSPLVADGAPRIRGRGPRCGEDTLALLAELDVGETEARQLVADRVVAVDP